jgi:hypothetical protein
MHLFAQHLTQLWNYGRDVEGICHQKRGNFYYFSKNPPDSPHRLDLNEDFGRKDFTLGFGFVDSLLY